MDTSAARLVVERDLEALLLCLGIPHWRVTVSYGPIDGADEGMTANGQCTRLLDYERAGITLDPAQFDDEEALLQTLRHELFHVVLAPFDLIRQWMLTGPAAGPEYSRALTVATHATECGVRNLERMWFGMTRAARTAKAAKPRPRASRKPTSKSPARPGKRVTGAPRAC